LRCRFGALTIGGSADLRCRFDVLTIDGTAFPRPDVVFVALFNDQDDADSAVGRKVTA